MVNRDSGMSKLPVPVLVLAACAVAYTVFVLNTTGLLPERVASHFDGNGTPNGWMPREVYLRFMVLFGLGMALFPVLLGQMMRVLPPWTFNLPHRDYWLAPERRAESVGWIRTHMVWLGVIIAGFMASIHWSVVKANISPSPRLGTSEMVSMLAVFVAACAWWSVVLLRRFRKPGTPRQS